MFTGSLSHLVICMALDVTTEMTMTKRRLSLWFSTGFYTTTVSVQLFRCIRLIRNLSTSFWSTKLL